MYEFIPARYADTARTRAINAACADIERLIPAPVGNRVWDRLDRMALEIEALATPIPLTCEE
jgi:hypothetical protein